MVRSVDGSLSQQISLAEFSDCVVLNSLTREKGDTKEFRRLVFRSFGKGRRETQKEFRQLLLGEFFLAKGEGNEKDE